MKITVAMDSFKGSLSSMMAGQAVSDGILRVYPEAEVQVRPLADGGEGTVEALVCGMGGKEERITVTGPVGKPVECSYGLIEKSGTAVIEMSGAAGIRWSQKKIEIPCTQQPMVLEKSFGMQCRKAAANLSLELAEVQPMTAGLGCFRPWDTDS